MKKGKKKYKYYSVKKPELIVEHMKAFLMLLM